MSSKRKKDAIDNIKDAIPEAFEDRGNPFGQEWSIIPASVMCPDIKCEYCAGKINGFFNMPGNKTCNACGTALQRLKKLQAKGTLKAFISRALE